MTSLSAPAGALASPRKANPAASLGPPAKILVVDDNPDNIRLLVAFLKSEGHHTLEATNGASARELAARELPDLILLDIMMPGESGLEVCAKLKDDPRTSAIPVIFQTALGDTDDKLSGFSVGCVDYVVKPIRKAEVLARVRAHLRIHQANKLLAAQHQQWLSHLRSAQRAILTSPSDLPEAHFGVCFQPLEETSGDFYDVYPIGGDRMAYFVADISGHGASAAFLTSALKVALRQHAAPGSSPENTLYGIDLVMRQILGEEQYVTACLVEHDRPSGSVTILSAGHPAALLISPRGQTSVVEADGCPIGAFDSLILHRYTAQVSRGDRVVLYTDGLIESVPGAGRAEGTAWLEDACSRRKNCSIAALPAEVVDELNALRPTADDDILMLAFEVVG